MKLKAWFKTLSDRIYRDATQLAFQKVREAVENGVNLRDPAIVADLHSYIYTFIEHTFNTSPQYTRWHDTVIDGTAQAIVEDAIEQVAGVDEGVNRFDLEIPSAPDWHFESDDEPDSGLVDEGGVF